MGKRSLADRLRPQVHRVVRNLVSKHTWLRRVPPNDGNVTLLTVDYFTSDDIKRLIRSFRRYVSATAPIIVVRNAPLRRNPFKGMPNVRTICLYNNLNHGLGLDVGLLFVRTQYTLICDPDSVIVNDRFWSEMKQRVDEYGIASIGREYYHPVGLAIPTAMWTSRPISLQHDWSRGLDAAQSLTELVGGVRSGSQLELTAVAPTKEPPLSPHEPCLGQVWSHCFSNMYAAARVLEPHRVDIDGQSFDTVFGYHAQWRSWADQVALGTADDSTFPRS